MLLEATARDPRLRAVVSDGATRPQDGREVGDHSLAQRVVGTLGLQAVRGISGMRPVPSLFGVMPDIAPRPVLLIAGGDVEEEVLANRRYRAEGGPGVELWTVPGAGHTAGLRERPAEFERRVIGFLERALPAPRR